MRIRYYLQYNDNGVWKELGRSFDMDQLIMDAFLYYDDDETCRIICEDGTLIWTKKNGLALGNSGY